MRWRWSVGFVGCVVAAGCGRSQGPLNPSFEEPCDDCVTPSTAASWSPFGPGFGLPGPARRSGTGFVPTDGVYFLDIELIGAVGSNPSTAGVRQDDVDLSSTSSLMFDYEAIGNVPATDVGGEDATATVEILFTSMGTIALWSKSFPVGEVNEQMRDVSAMVDAPSDPGRMIIQVTLESRDANDPELDFRIDNLRVE